MSLLNKVKMYIRIWKQPKTAMSFYIQRQIRNPKKRLEYAKKEAEKVNKVEPFEIKTQYSEYLRELERNGFTYISDILSKDQVEEIRNYLDKQEMFDLYRLNKGKFTVHNVPEETHVGNFDAETMVNCPYIFDIANHPKIISIVSQYLGCKPTINYILGWRSFIRNSAPQHPQNYHRDVDDFKIVKLFLYLTDVDINSGPHYYVKGSAKVNKCTELRRFLDDEIEKTFGKDNIVPHLAPAGTIILEDTYGIHKGAVPVSKERMIIQIIYSIRRLPYSPSKPIVDPKRFQKNTRYDEYMNRLYIKKYE